MNSREQILGRVRANQPPPAPLPDVPSFEGEVESLLGAFTAALTRMGGVRADPPARGSLDTFLFERFPHARVICSATPEVRGTRSIASVKTPAELDDVDVGVVRAAFGVAETGSVGLSEAEFGLNALGFLSQHLVVLLDPSSIVANLHLAYRRSEFREARYAVLMSGPSATADIEGVLVRGAQGIRTLTVIPLAVPTTRKVTR